MANQSIFNAFERMWQHIINALGTKADVNHTHDEKDRYDLIIKCNEYNDTNSEVDQFLIVSGNARDVINKRKNDIDADINVLLTGSFVYGNHHFDKKIEVTAIETNWYDYPGDDNINISFVIDQYDYKFNTNTRNVCTLSIEGNDIDNNVITNFVVTPSDINYDLRFVLDLSDDDDRDIDHNITADDFVVYGGDSKIVEAFNEVYNEEEINVTITGLYRFYSGATHSFKYDIIHIEARSNNYSEGGWLLIKFLLPDNKIGTLEYHIDNYTKNVTEKYYTIYKLKEQEGILNIEFNIDKYLIELSGSDLFYDYQEVINLYNDLKNERLDGNPDISLKGKAYIGNNVKKSVVCLYVTQVDTSGNSLYISFTYGQNGCIGMGFISFTILDGGDISVTTTFQKFTATSI